MSDLINIENKDGQLVVSSREVAKNFEKEHRDVTKAVDNLIGGVRNFAHTPGEAENRVAEKSADPREPKNEAGGQSAKLRSDLESGEADEHDAP